MMVLLQSFTPVFTSLMAWLQTIAILVPFMIVRTLELAFWLSLVGAGITHVRVLGKL